jgi:integrase/recombinase XerD
VTTAAPSTALATIQPAFIDAERLALAGYRGLTRDAYALDLRQFTTWCRARSLNLFAGRRADIEGFARDLEARGRAQATRRLCTIAGFYRYAVEEELLDHSPAAHVRRPRLDYESRAVALDRNELGALLIAAGLGSAPEHALISLLPRCRITARLREQAAHEVAERGVTPAEAARHAGISWPVAHGAFAAAVDPLLGQSASPVAHLGIDEHRRGRARFAVDEQTGGVHRAGGQVAHLLLRPGRPAGPAGPGGRPHCR